jgi:hypothetical protein
MRLLRNVYVIEPEGESFDSSAGRGGSIGSEVANASAKPAFIGSNPIRCSNRINEIRLNLRNSSKL